MVFQLLICCNYWLFQVVDEFDNSTTDKHDFNYFQREMIAKIVPNILNHHGWELGQMGVEALFGIGLMVGGYFLKKLNTKVQSQAKKEQQGLTGIKIVS